MQKKVVGRKKKKREKKREEEGHKYNFKPEGFREKKKMKKVINIILKQKVLGR